MITTINKPLGKIKKIKRAKRAIVKFIETKSYYSEYKCPHCRTIIKGGIDKNTTRFICTVCGNEIIINKGEK